MKLDIDMHEVFIKNSTKLVFQLQRPSCLKAAATSKFKIFNKKTHVYKLIWTRLDVHIVLAKI